MALSPKTLFTLALNFFLFLFLFSCSKDSDLISSYSSKDEKPMVLDDNFRIPSHEESILDVLSNDIHLSNNIRIVDVSTPTRGSVLVNEDNTITYIPRSVYTLQDSNEVINGATISEEEVPQEISSEELTIQENSDAENDSEEAIQEESASEEITTVETSPEEATTSENTSAADEEDTVNNENVEATSTETNQEGNTTEEENTQQTETDTFTYTTETENEDGTVTTETGTVTVEVETSPEEEPESEPDTLTEPETDYWREPVIAATRLLDEKYYDLDTGEVYPKDVNLQRGQVENYVEHENCPQRIKDKWNNRIEIFPSDVNGSHNGLQAIFDAHPRGSLFYLRAGVYQDQRNAVLRNDQDIVGEYGAILDGSGIQGTSEDSTRAIRSIERGYICNLKVREYPTWNDPQNPKNPRGAALEVIQNGAILNCEVHSQNKAISLIYSSKAMWNKITAGRLGIYAYGSHELNNPNRRGTIAKYNEWYDCNFNGYDGEHEAGGAKFVQVDGVIWSHNYIHDIPSGGGIWQDGDNQGAEIYNNVIIRTHRSVFSELSHTSNVHHNTIEYGTGFGAVYMSNSQGEKVHHNFIRWCRNGITIRDKERGTSKIYPGQAWRGINNEIYNNHIWQQSDPTTWTHGVATLFDGHIDPNNTTNKWHDNHYFVDDNAEGTALFSQEDPFSQVFMYSKLAADSDHVTISWEEWQNHSGEKNSTLEYAPFFGS